MATVEELSEAIQKGNAPKAKELTTGLLAAKADNDDDGNEGGHRKVRKRGPDQYAKEIGADGYAPDAASAAEKLKTFVS